MNLEEQYTQFNFLLAHSNFREAENTLQEILTVPDQPWQQYLYQPASFYESWGDYENNNAVDAARHYQKALQYRYQIGSYATGSGEGLEAMYHIRRIQKKLKEMPQQ
jgi:hypothetical protein